MPYARSGKARFLLYQGIYGGMCILCLLCKGITYIPADKHMYQWVDLETWEHTLWCPAILDEVLAELYDSVNPGDDASGTVAPEGN